MATVISAAAQGPCLYVCVRSLSVSLQVSFRLPSGMLCGHADHPFWQGSFLYQPASPNVCVQSLAKANRQRLAVLLGEVQSGKHSEDRYEAALRGESLGTHSRGTTVGAQSIRNRTEDKQR